MPGPKPAPAPEPGGHIETRLLVVAEMLEKAVAEVRRAMDEIKSGVTTTPPDQPAPKADPGLPEEVRKPDVQ